VDTGNETGNVQVFPAASAVLTEWEVDPLSLLVRFVNGDWGSVLPEESAMNNQAADTGDFLVGRYPVGDTTINVVVGRDRQTYYVVMTYEMAIDDRGGGND
jgi:hypothetical protein